MWTRLSCSFATRPITSRPRSLSGLDPFDAFTLALTATSAQHITQIFGLPDYTYIYQEAVIDDWLVDHLPPIRWRTLLSQHGIHFDSGQTVTLLDILGSEARQVLPDEVDYEIDQFKRLVITGRRPGRGPERPHPAAHYPCRRDQGAAGGSAAPSAAPSSASV